MILLVITDGRRDCITRTIPSALEQLHGPLATKLIYDDSGDPDNRAWLDEQFGPLGFIVFAHPKGRQGFGGAIRFAWAHIATTPRREFVFHLEDDFTFNRPVDLLAMAKVLNARPHLVQLALRRQPWNDEERAAGGIVEAHPADFVEHNLEGTPLTWLEHRRFFTTNPSLYRASLCRQPWPRGKHSEGRFTHQLLASPRVRFGYWGARATGEWVHHIGHERVGIGY